MARPYLELVAVLLEHARTNKSYSINYVYRLNVQGMLVGNIVMKGYDMPVSLEPFDKIVEHAQDAYAPVLLRSWGQGTAKHDSVYLELVAGYDPHQTAMGGKWACFLERD